MDREQKMEKRELELYVHIPFCVKKCAYCDFLSHPSGREEQSAYIDALLTEIAGRSKNYIDCRVSTVFLGGGTPSILDGDDTARIFHALREHFDISEDAEITMEVNPGTASEEKLKAWRQCGINRLSIGLQSANDKELRMLGRIHTYHTFLETFRLAREAGFDNINVDLISAIPGQTCSSWENTLRTVAELGPEHISAYSLIIEEGTPFYERYGKGGGFPPLPSEEEERAIYERTADLLEEYGYHRYEISNYAKEGRWCRHNLGYWERKEYLGLGLGASSLVGEQRFHNTQDIQKYIRLFGSGRQAAEDEIREEEETLSLQEQMEEYMFLGLRKTEGITEEGFFQSFHRPFSEVYGETAGKLEEKGLLVRRDGRVYLTRRGIDISNYVFAEFLFDR